MHKNKKTRPHKKHAVPLSLQPLEPRQLLSAAYTLTLLGSLPSGGNSAGTALNDNGDVVGWALNSSGSQRAVLFTSTGITDLPTPLNAATSSAIAINNNGQIIGQYTLNSALHSFLDQNSTLSDLESQNGSPLSAAALNNNGTILANLQSPSTGVFTDSNGNFTDLSSTLPNSTATAINDTNEIVGYSFSPSLAAPNVQEFFLDDNNNLTFLPPSLIGADSTTAVAINDNAQIAGYSTTDSSDTAFVDSYTLATNTWNIEQIGPFPGGTTSRTTALNNAGDAVGYGDTEGGSLHAFVYNDGSIQDLNNLISPIPGLTLTQATGINNHGQICGTATLSSGLQEAFLLTPLPPVLAFTQPPVSTPGAVPINTVTVSIEDPNGNILINDNSPVTLSLHSGQSASLLGTLTQNAVNGIATFTDLSLATAGNYTLQATDPGDLAATSDSFAIGPLELRGNFTSGTSSGPVDIGLTPAPGDPFVPLLHETTGTVTYNATTISASGTFSVPQSNLASPLFTGNFTIPIAATTTDTLSAQTTLTLANLPVTFSSLTFNPSTDSTPTDARLTLTGGFSLPALNNLHINVPTSSPFSVTSAGFSIDPNPIAVQSPAFLLGNLLEVQPKTLSFQYLSATQELQIRGTLGLPYNNGPTPSTLDLTLSGNNFIDYQSTRKPIVQINATLNYANTSPTTLFNNALTVSAAQLTINTTTNKIAGSLTLTAPTGNPFSGNLTFSKGFINSLPIQAANLSIPMIPPGLSLQAITGNGALTGLAPGSKNQTLTGNLAFSLGSLVSATLHASLILDQTNHFQNLSAQASLNINQLATGSAKFNANFNAGTLSLTSVSLAAFNNSLSFQGSLNASTDGTLTGSGTGKATLPASFGATTLPATLNAFISSDPSQSNLTAITQETALGLPIAVGIQHNFDNTTNLLNANPLPIPLTPEFKSTAVIPTPIPVSQSFTVSADTPYIILSASWTTPASKVPFQIIAPDGTIFSSTNLPKNQIALLSSFSSTKALSIAIKNPLPGTWQLLLPNTNSLGTVTLQAFAPTPASSIQLLTPASPATGNSTTLSYLASDSNSSAQVSLFYTTQSSGLTGTLIAANLPTGNHTFTWQAPTLPANTYHLYALLTDNLSLPTSSYAPSTLTIFPTLAFATQPGAAPIFPGKAITPPVIVDILDTDGQILTTDNSKVTLTLASGPGALTLTTTANHGIATVSNNIILNQTGNYALLATDSADAPATSSPFTISPSPTTLSKPTVAAAYIVGQTLKLSATLTSLSPTSLVHYTGTVILIDSNNNPIAAGTVTTSGTITFSFPAPTPATYTCTIQYANDPNHSTTTSPTFLLHINPIPTTTTLTLSASSLSAGQPLTLTASVSPTAATGSITFFDGPTNLGSINLTNGSAQLLLPTPTTGPHSYAALYTGATKYSSSSSSKHTLTILKDKPTAALTSSLTSPLPTNSPTDLTAQFTLPAGITTTFTGNVTFKDGSKILATLPISSSGAATLPAFTFTTPGRHTLTASYSGDLNINPLTTPQLVLLITPE